MNIKESLLSGHSKARTMKIVNYVGDDKKRFRELITAFLEGEYRLTQRAAWPLSYCGTAHPKWILSYTQKLLNKLREPNIHNAVKRNILRVWQNCDLHEKYAGEIYDVCNGYLHSLEEPIAIRVFAMSVMANLCKKFPELSPELKMMVEDMIPFGGPAIRSRGKKVLKELEKQKAK